MDTRTCTPFAKKNNSRVPESHYVQNSASSFQPRTSLCRVLVLHEHHDTCATFLLLRAGHCSLAARVGAFRAMSHHSSLTSLPKTLGGTLSGELTGPDSSSSSLSVRLRWPRGIACRCILRYAQLHCAQSPLQITALVAGRRVDRAQGCARADALRSAVRTGTLEPGEHE